MNKPLTDAMKKADKDFENEMAQPTQTTISSRTSVRGDVLMQAGKLITGDRADAYGNYRDQMISIAEMFNAMNNGVKDTPKLSGHDISMIMHLLKLRRLVTSQDIDSSVDLCGYTALHAEHFTSKDKG